MKPNFLDIDRVIRDGKLKRGELVKEILDKNPLKFFGIGDLHEGSGYSRFNGDMLNRLCRHAETVGKVDVLGTMGDLAEGDDRKGGGIHLTTTEVDDQVTDVVEKLARLVRILEPKVVTGLCGSKYHTKSGNSNLDRRVIQQLSIYFPKILFIYGTELFLRFGRLNWYMRHWYSIGRSRTMKLEAMMQDRVWEAHTNNGDHADVHGFAHSHQPLNVIEIPGRGVYGFVVPCFKESDPFLMASGRPRIHPIGVILIEQNYRTNPKVWGHVEILDRPLRSVDVNELLSK